MANAGRVAIVPKGEYSATVAYKRLDLVRYNEKAYVAKKANTGVAPTNTEYWMLMTSDGIAIDAALSDTSTNPVQNKVVKTAVDNIQTTSMATLSAAGWYRVAEYKGTSETNLLGNLTNSCKIALKRVSTSNSGTCRLYFESKYQSQEFKVESVNIKSNAFSKIRYAYDASALKAYLEVYCTTSNVELHVTITDSASLIAWQAITPTLTSETVDGVTVTTTYDIPANASPVTDLDLKGMTSTSCELLQTSILEKAKEYTGLAIARDFGFVLSGDNYSGGDLPASQYKYCSAVVQVRYTSAVVTITGIQVGAVYYPSITNYYDGSSWKGWKTFATTADLANYLSNSGGTVSGNLAVALSGLGSVYFNILNSARNVYQEVDGGGSYWLWDATNSKSIIHSTKDGTNTFNGTATGNLPLTGGTVSNAVVAPFVVNNTTSGATETRIGFIADNSALGYLGCNGVNVPAFFTSDGVVKPLLHSGNSAKVAIQESAPTDTTALWVDTANKKTKAYIDGAWTVIA